MTTNLYPVIRHRNHLAILANNPAVKTNDIYDYNFTTGAGQIYGNGKVLLGSLWGMLAGDSNGDGTIQTGDKTIWTSTFNQNGYKAADFTLDHSVQTGDKTRWTMNFNKNSSVP